MTLEADGIKVRDEVIFVDFKPIGVDMMLGMKVIRLQRGVSISPLRKVMFGSSYCGTAVLNKKKDQAVFDGVEWRVKWKWRDGEGPNQLYSKVEQYGIPKYAKVDYENKLQDWIN